MTDVLYIVGNTSQHGNAELRWSLRSLAKYARGLGRVVVAGYPPEFLSGDVSCLPVPDLLDWYKHHNILAAILAAIDAGAVKGDFLYSSDDHFLAAPCDLDRWPFFFKAASLPVASSYKGEPTQYQKSLIRTRKLLEAAGLDPRNWSSHANTHMHTADAPRVRELVSLGERLGLARFGFEPTCLFMAARAEREGNIVPSYRADIKMGAQFTLPKPAPLPFTFIDARAAIERYGLADISRMTYHGRAVSPLQVFRMVAPLLPEFAGLDRLLYCDIDVEFRSPRFAEALALDFPGEIGAVHDGERFSRRHAPVVAALRPSFRPGQYVNSGVLVMDLPRIRANHPTLAADLPRWISLCADRRLGCVDQDLINAFFDCSIIPQPFNVLPWQYNGGDAFIVHYASKDKLSGVYPPPASAARVLPSNSQLSTLNSQLSTLNSPTLLFCVDGSPRARGWLHHALATLAEVSRIGGLSPRVFIASDSPYPSPMPASFSISDEAFDCPEFMSFMSAEFPAPCRFEKEFHS